MKYKSLVLPVLILALVTALVSTYVSMRSSRVEIFDSMPMHSDGEYGRADSMMGNSVPPSAGISLEEDMMINDVEPLIGKTSRPYFPPYYPDDALDVDDRVYEKSAYMQVLVNDVGEYARNMKEYFLSIDGRVLSSSINTSGKYHSAYLYVKVPVDKFDGATNRVTENVEEIISEDISAQDVTGQKVSRDEQVVDLKDQIAEKQIELVEAETQVEKNRIELQLQRLNEQLKQAENAQGQVEERVSYATISISVSNDDRYYDPSREPTLWEEAERAWESVSGILYQMAVMVIRFVVFSILWLPVVLIIKFVMSKRKTDNSAEEESESK